MLDLHPLTIYIYIYFMSKLSTLLGWVIAASIIHPSISTALMRPRRPKQYSLQLVIYIYIYIFILSFSNCSSAISSLAAHNVIALSHSVSCSRVLGHTYVCHSSDVLLRARNAGKTWCDPPLDNKRVHFLFHRFRRHCHSRVLRLC